MSLLQKEQLLEIDGGISISGTLLNSINGLFKTILEIGRSIGTSIVRVSTGKMCKM